MYMNKENNFKLIGPKIGTSGFFVSLIKAVTSIGSLLFAIVIFLMNQVMLGYNNMESYSIVYWATLYYFLSAIYLMLCFMVVINDRMTYYFLSILSLFWIIPVIYIYFFTDDRAGDMETVIILIIHIVILLLYKYLILPVSSSTKAQPQNIK